MNTTVLKEGDKVKDRHNKNHIRHVVSYEEYVTHVLKPTAPDYLTVSYANANRERFDKI